MMGSGMSGPTRSSLPSSGTQRGAIWPAQVGAVSSDPHAEIPLPRAIIALMPGEVFPMREPNLRATFPGRPFCSLLSAKTIWSSVTNAGGRSSLARQPFRFRENGLCCSGPIAMDSRR